MKVKEERGGLTISTTVDPEAITAVVVKTEGDETADTIILKGGAIITMVPPEKTDQKGLEEMLLFERKEFRKTSFSVGNDAEISIIAGPYSVGAVQSFNNNDALSIKLLFTDGGAYSIPIKLRETRKKIEEAAEEIKSIIEDKLMKRFI